MSMFGIRLNDQLERRLAQMAKQRGTTKSALAREAIRRFLLSDKLSIKAREQSQRVSQQAWHELDIDDDEWQN